MVKGGHQQVLSVAYSYKAPVWCHYCKKNLLLLFFPLSLNKPPWRTKLTDTPPWWTLEKLGAGHKFCSRWAFHQLNVKRNNAILTTLQLWSVRGYFPSASSPRVQRKTNKAVAKDVWEGLPLKPRTCYSTGTLCWGTLVSTPLEAFLVGTCACRLAPTSGLCFSFLGRRTMQAAPCWSHVWARAVPPPPSLLWWWASPLEECWGLEPPPWGTQQ